MKNYDWRKEREKYRLNPQSENGNPAPTVEPPKRKSYRWLFIVVPVILVILGGAFVLNNYYLDSAKMLARAAEKNKNAVALVTFSAVFKDGPQQTFPIGTAWAFEKNKFATNAHVANAFRTASKAIINAKVQSILNTVAQKNNCKSVDEFLKRLGPQKAPAIMNIARKRALSELREFRADLIINGTYRKSFPITHVQIHRDYQLKNGTSPDIAVLTVAGEHDVYFKAPSKKQLHNLKSGEPVAFLGFPSESLVGGNVNMDNPVASMQSGIIVAVSAFNLKDVGGEGNVLIRHNLPATGGASGSPIFNRHGEVVAILFGGNIVGQILDNGKISRAPSAAQINYAIRVDLINGMGNMIKFEDFLK